VTERESNDFKLHWYYFTDVQCTRHIISATMHSIQICMHGITCESCCSHLAIMLLKVCVQELLMSLNVGHKNQQLWKV